jgi:hypothetical protein
LCVSLAARDVTSAPSYPFKPYHMPPRGSCCESLQCETLPCTYTLHSHISPRSNPPRQHPSRRRANHQGVRFPLQPWEHHTPRPPATLIVYSHRASSPPLASASTPPHDTNVHPARSLPLNDPGPRTVCMLRVTSAPAPSYERRLTFVHVAAERGVAVSARWFGEPTPPRCTPAIPPDIVHSRSAPNTPALCGVLRDGRCAVSPVRPVRAARDRREHAAALFPLQVHLLLFPGAPASALAFPPLRLPSHRLHLCTHARHARCSHPTSRGRADDSGGDRGEGPRGAAGRG